MGPMETPLFQRTNSPICQEEDPDGAEGDLSLGRGGVKVKGGRDDGCRWHGILCTYKVKIDGKSRYQKVG